MANINLISARRAEQVRMARLARGLLVTAGLTGAVGLGGVVYLSSQLFSTKNRIAETNRQLEELKPLLQEIARNEAERKELQPKLATLTEAQKRTKWWFEVLDGLKRVVPAETWLTNVAVEARQGNRALRISGITVNQTRVGETMYRLNLQPEYYKRVDLRYTQARQGAAEQQNVEFELAALLNEPKPEKPEKEGGDEAKAK